MISEELKELLIESKDTNNSRWYPKLVDDVLKQNDINFVSPSKDTILLLNICDSNNLELIEMLLEQGADVNHQGRWGTTSLMVAAQYNMVEKAKILLKYNPNLDLEDNARRTALEMAQIFNSHEVEELILEKMKNNGYLKPFALFNAGIKKSLISLSNDNQIKIKINEELKKLLIESKKNFNNTCYKELVDMVIKTNNINYENENKDTLLMWVVLKAFTGNFLIEKLLDSGADINHQNCDGYTPLMTSIDYNNEEKVEILLKYNPDLSLKNIKGETAYDIACRLNYRRIAELLLFQEVENDNQEIESKKTNGLTDEQVKKLKMAINR